MCLDPTWDALLSNILNFSLEGSRLWYKEQGRNVGALFDLLNVVNYL